LNRLACGTVPVQHWHCTGAQNQSLSVFVQILFFGVATFRSVRKTAASAMVR
jgi:hypothetical protein